MAFDTVEPGRLTLVCADLDARPLFWTEPSGARYGFEPAIAEAAAAHMGLETRWLFCRWSDFAPELEAGRADAIWCGCAITPERSRQFLFSRPYALFHESVLVRRGEGIDSPDGLNGRRVGAIAGSTNMALGEQWPGCELVDFDGTSDDVFAEMVGSLADGSIDAVIDDEPAFGGTLSDPRFELAFTVKTGNRWGVAMRPGSRELKLALDDALGALKASGCYRQTWMQWLEYIEYPGLPTDNLS